jgi:hypothetical protein
MQYRKVEITLITNGIDALSTSPSDYWAFKGTASIMDCHFYVRLPETKLHLGQDMLAI